MAVSNILERKCFMELIATACDASLAMTEKEFMELIATACDASLAMTVAVGNILVQSANTQQGDYARQKGRNSIEKWQGTQCVEWRKINFCKNCIKNSCKILTMVV